MTLYIRLAIALAILAAVGYFARHVYDSGVQAEVAKVQKASAAATATLEAKVTTAEHAHDQELADLTAYRDAHPDQPVRLCLSTPAPSVRPVATASGPPSAPAVNLQPMPAGDSGSGPGATGPDIGSLLGLLAARGDALAAQLRTRQAVDP